MELIKFGITFEIGGQKIYNDILAPTEQMAKQILKDEIKFVKIVKDGEAQTPDEELKALWDYLNLD